MKKLPPECIAAADLVIHAFVRVQEHLAPIDATCDCVIAAMIDLKDGRGCPAAGSLEQLVAAEGALSGLDSAIAGLAIVGPAVNVIRRGIEEYLDNA